MVAQAATDGIAAVAFGAGLGVVGWLVKRWINGLTDLVNSRGDNIEGQVDAVAAHVIMLDDKVDEVQVSVAEVRGALGMPVPVPARRR